MQHGNGYYGSQRYDGFKGMQPAPHGASATWTTFCRRTEDPKLAFIEKLLDQRGIPHRRNGHSFHAPILEVPSQHADAAWKMLSEDIFGDGQRLDDIEDDDPVFTR